jgi:hypothetical protein
MGMSSNALLLVEIMTFYSFYPTNFVGITTLKKYL